MTTEEITALTCAARSHLANGSPFVHIFTHLPIETTPQIAKAMPEFEVKLVTSHGAKVIEIRPRARCAAN